MFRLWGYFNHANIRLNLGVLTPVISGPQWHRIHHSIRPEHRNRNFATFFPVIDIIFGTYYRPAPDEYPETGLSDGDTVGFLQDVTYEPLRVWARSFGLNEYGVRARLLSLFGRASADAGPNG